MSYTCKYCKRSYELEYGYNIDFHSYDCKNKYEADMAEKERREEAQLERHNQQVEENNNRYEEAQEEARERAEKSERRERRFRNEIKEQNQEKLQRMQRFFLRACQTGDIAEVKQSLKDGLDPNFEIDDSTPLITALRKSQFDVINILITYSDINPNLPAGIWTPLMYCVFDDNASAFKILCKLKNCKLGLTSWSQLCALFINLTNPKNKLTKENIKQIFHDNTFYPDTIRMAAVDEIFKNEKAEQLLLTYVDEAYVKEVLDLNIIVLRKKREEEIRSKKEEKRLLQENIQKETERKEYQKLEEALKQANSSPWKITMPEIDWYFIYMSAGMIVVFITKSSIKNGFFLSAIRILVYLYILYFLILLIKWVIQTYNIENERKQEVKKLEKQIQYYRSQQGIVQQNDTYHSSRFFSSSQQVNIQPVNEDYSSIIYMPHWDCKCGYRVIGSDTCPSCSKSRASGEDL